MTSYNQICKTTVKKMVSHSMNVCCHILPQNLPLIVHNCSNNFIPYSTRRNFLQYYFLRESVMSYKQHTPYDIVLSWCRNKIKKTTYSKPRKHAFTVDPIYPFFTAGAGSNKSHLIKETFASK